MGPEWVAIIGLVALFVVGTVLPINMGALAYVAAWLVGMYSLDLDEKEILAGVSGDLILTLIGVTYLFAIAKNNGTVDLIVRSAVKAVQGRVALIPWVMFAVTALLTAIGAVSPAACAIIGPIALGFAGRYGISALMMGMFVVHGAQAGGFSPISIYGSITNSVMEDAGLPNSEITIFLASLVVNTIMAAILFVVLGGRDLMSKRVDPDEGDTLGDELHSGGASVPARGLGTSTQTTTQALGVRRDQILTLVAFVLVALVALIFDKNIGFVAITAAVILAMLSPGGAQGRRQAGRVAHRAAGGRCQHLRNHPRDRWLTGVRRELGRRARCGRGGCAGALLCGRRRVGVCLLDRSVAGDHPDRAAADRRRRHQRRAFRGGAGRVVHDRGRQPVLDQRRAHAGQPTTNDRGAGLLQADPHVQRDRGVGRAAPGLGRPRAAGMVT